MYVCDTNAIISYFGEVFEQPKNLSDRALNIIQQAFIENNSKIRLSVPSVVFIEIFEKWALDEEFLSKFYYEVLVPISQTPNIEIKPIEREVLENLIKIDGNLKNHEIHDKLILASAMMLDCPLITTDGKIIEYVKRHKVIPSTVS